MIRRKKPIERKKRLASVSAKRLAALAEYDLTRRRVLAEAKGACARCGWRPKRAGLDVHHIVPRSRGGLLGPCVALCRRCHDELHHGTTADRGRWIRKKSAGELDLGVNPSR